MKWRFFLALLGVTACGANSNAEFVQIERLLAPVVKELAGQISDRTVVVAARHLGEPVYWEPHEAFGVELTAALCEAGVDAVRSADDPRSISLGARNNVFTASDARTVKLVDRDLLTTATIALAPVPKVELALFQASNGRKFWSRQLDLPEKLLDVEANVPLFNELSRRFCIENLNQCVGGGECSELAQGALESANAVRSGIYTWGRELGEREPILPGDIVQMELVKLTTSGFSRSFAHHTAVVERVQPNALVVLHQNVGDRGRVVQRDTWPRSATQTGTIVFYRPWSGESSLPSVSPRRRLPAKVVRRGDTVNLLETVDPRLDSVKGIWFWEGGLRCNRDTAAKLQVPVELPESYSLNLRLRRTFGDDALGIGVVVGGHQTTFAIDGYHGKVSGIHTLDGKKCHSNETTYRGELLPLGQVVEVTIHVTRESVGLKVDGNTIFDWHGDPARLGILEEYKVPRADWLSLAGWNTQFDVSAFELTEH